MSLLMALYLYILSQGLSPEGHPFGKAVCPMIFRVQPVSVFPMLGLEEHVLNSQDLHICAGHQNAGPWACAADTLMIESPPQPLC